MELLTDLYVSELIGRPVVDRSGRRVGKVADLVINPETPFPIVQSLVVKKQGGVKGIPWPDIYLLSRRFVALQVTEAEVHYESVSEESYRTSMILDRQIVDMHGAKVVRVNDIKLAGDGNSVHVISIDVGISGLVRRLFPQGWGSIGLGEQWLKPHLIRWDYLQPLPRSGDTLALKVSADKLAKMHPADLGQIMESLSHRERRELFAQLDPEVAADALAEVELDVQIALLKDMDKEKAADILEEMDQDEAADLLSELPDEDSNDLLSLMEDEDASHLRELLEYEEGTAGSMMTTEVVAFSQELTAEEVIHRLRELAPDADYVYYLYVVDSDGRLAGVISLRELIICPPQRKIAEAMRTKVIAVTPDADEKQIRRLFTRYSLLALPVVDSAGVLIGLITVDDVLALPVNTRGLKI